MKMLAPSAIGQADADAGRTHLPWRAVVVAFWLAFLALAAYAYFLQRELLSTQLTTALSVSTLLGGSVYLVSSCLRGFTLIPSTFLIVAGLPFFSPAALYTMTMVGIAISASSLYGLSHLVGIDRLLERRHPDQLARIRAALSRKQFRIVLGWSFFPLVPTDLICYACGSLRTRFRTFLLAVLIGEGLICAAYIFLGDRLLDLLKLA
jgi:uncharacterized membrane protein YdjX (TVP38/TMEM64 family)